MAEEADEEIRQKSTWIELIPSSVVSLQQAKAIFPALQMPFCLRTR